MGWGHSARVQASKTWSSFDSSPHQKKRANARRPTASVRREQPPAKTGPRREKATGEKEGPPHRAWCVIPDARSNSALSATSQRTADDTVPTGGARPHGPAPPGGRAAAGRSMIEPASISRTANEPVAFDRKTERAPAQPRRARHSAPRRATKTTHSRKDCSGRPPRACMPACGRRNGQSAQSPPCCVCLSRLSLREVCTLCVVSIIHFRREVMDDASHILFCSTISLSPPHCHRRSTFT